MGSKGDYHKELLPQQNKMANKKVDYSSNGKSIFFSGHRKKNYFCALKVLSVGKGP